MYIKAGLSHFLNGEEKLKPEYQFIYL